MLRNRTRKKLAKLQAEEEEAKKPKTVPHWKKNLQNEKQLQDTAKQKVSFSFSKNSLADTDDELSNIDNEKDPELSEVSQNSQTNKSENDILSNNKFIQEVKEHEHESIIELNNIKLYMVDNEGGYKNAKDILFYNIII